MALSAHAVETPRTFGRSTMVDAGKYRANALHCLRMANKALNSDNEQIWLNMAETRLGMIPERQRMPEEIFEKAVRDRGTRQEPSKSRH